MERKYIFPKKINLTNTYAGLKTKELILISVLFVIGIFGAINIELAFLWLVFLSLIFYLILKRNDEESENIFDTLLLRFKFKKRKKELYKNERKNNEKIHGN